MPSFWRKLKTTGKNLKDLSKIKKNWTFFTLMKSKKSVEKIQPE